MSRRRERPPRATGGEGKGPTGADHTPGPAAKCILCRAPSAVLGVMLPHDSQLWGAPAGKDRVIGYGVCPACVDLPNLTDLVEERIFAVVAGGAA